MRCFYSLCDFCLLSILPPNTTCQCGTKCGIFFIIHETIKKRGHSPPSYM
uniref:Uncharacterized protein n=1 Tax=Siphoviridae sp. ctlzn3 TaxID=2826450 RepID=A0A8S5N5P3_9CAUD|nr:MAG TPA: hypothetical protein [Siphoviridae sp. ctlzn3]